MPFRFERLDIADVVLVRATASEDDRGFFKETYKRSEFAAGGISWSFVQDNFSHSIRGVVRGLHYQIPPKAQAKLVTVVSGEIYDVAVDIRVGSPTYGRWVGVQLAAQDHCHISIPSGFAHGFQVLSQEADVVYKVSEEYVPELDRGIAWDDPRLGIAWPMKQARVSLKDSRLPALAEAENPFVYERRGS